MLHSGKKKQALLPLAGENFVEVLLHSGKKKQALLPLTGENFVEVLLHSDKKKQALLPLAGENFVEVLLHQSVIGTKQQMNLRPKKLDIFLVKQFAILFVGALLICQFVLMMQFLWKSIDDLIGKGLSLDVLAQFFFYLGLMIIPQALPLAILLSSLIAMGNLGESSELTAIKAAGISLMQAFRSLILFTVMICITSFIFQNYVAPQANLKLMQLLVSMKQKSPELEIPEGVFYDGIPQSNIFVHKKNVDTGKLYGVTIYRMTGSYEDQAIILADSGMLQSTADKKHLMLTLWNGEWFENMQSQELGNKASVPYRRETFYHKQILIDFDGDFNMTDASLLSNDARGKGLPQLIHDIDSLQNRKDSVGRALYAEMTPRFYRLQGAETTAKDTVKVAKAKKTAETRKAAAVEKIHFDSIYARLSKGDKQISITNTTTNINNSKSELDFRGLVAKDTEQLIRSHRLQQIAKFTLALQCLIFFFIGAPLGAIIRKGGLGTPVIISVMVFILYYILDNSSTRLARIGEWNLWFGSLFSTMILTPLAVFITYKANNDSVVFNFDTYKETFNKLLGLRSKRNIASKEVIIEDPNYASDAEILADINSKIAEYEQEHNLKHLPNVIDIFFKYKPDHEIEQINDVLESVIENLGNTRDKVILTEINHYPIIAVKAHTRPFEKKWMNILSAIILPVGLFLYLRMTVFRLRLHHDLQVIKQTNNNICEHIRQVLCK